MPQITQQQFVSLPNAVPKTALNIVAVSEPRAPAAAYPPQFSTGNSSRTTLPDTRNPPPAAAAAPPTQAPPDTSVSGANTAKRPAPEASDLPEAGRNPKLQRTSLKARNPAEPLDEKCDENHDMGSSARSCDICWTHSLPCPGKFPCDACFKQRVECTFRRLARSSFASSCSRLIRHRSETRRSSSVGGSQTLADSAADRVAQAIEPLQFPTKYADEETPPLVFLHSAWRRIAIAQGLGRLSKPPPAQRAADQLELVSGDLPLNTSSAPVIPVYPEPWFLLQEKFAIGWTETFHFIHRLTARSWLETVHRNWSAQVPLENGIGHAKATVALMTAALGSLFDHTSRQPAKYGSRPSWLWTVNNGDQLFLISLRLTDLEPGPPKLESVQARLLQALYLLCTCRLSQAWYVFGNAIHMLTVLGLHRRRGRNRGLGPEIVTRPEYAKVQCERRTMWSAYVLDKQIAMMSGRPAYLNLDAIDQDYPDCVNDEDMGRAGPFRPHKGDCYVEALIEQAKLSKIVEKVLREVYTLEDTSEEERLENAWRLGKALDDWKAQLPYLMSSSDPSRLHLTWHRQHDMLQLAHWHAQVLVYRPFMTAPYPAADLKKKERFDFAIRTCTEAARATLAMTVNLARKQADGEESQFHTLLYAHHVMYCAAAVIFLTPHTRARQKASGSRCHEASQETDDDHLFKLAEEALKALVQETNKFSPARLWAVILEELRDEAAQQIPKDKDQEAEQDPESRSDDLKSADEQPLEDALRAHWEAELAQETRITPNGDNSSTKTASQPATPIFPRLWDKWKTTDWLDLDSAAFGPISAFAHGDVPIAPPKR
ncbi:fungal-specific transcription factor domain-containing protein [Achaetomium macrosporum]|uniref:Fungal-specific transcription factor domain-containing protein n=1 Tax=Achaetomium macrosporum TaxID=79813 RepID=A0AAN7C5A9_9PEZI|nr:fungal-specific transcription factor domain-containing protein [Achaetomium macrosporum]